MARRQSKKQHGIKLPWYISLLIMILIAVFGHEQFLDPGPKNFVEAKHIARRIFQQHPVTFYCGCQFDAQGVVKHKQCGYQTRVDAIRARKIEFEHLMPAHFFGKHLACWSRKLCQDSEGRPYRGRKCCQKIDANYRLMEADLHNIVPAIGEINKLRSNYQFKELPDIKPTRFGKCHLKFDPLHRLMEPPVTTRGLIARSYLYMSERYDIALSPDEQQMFTRWHAAYPPDDWERQWEQQVKQAQGNHNPYRELESKPSV